MPDDALPADGPDDVPEGAPAPPVPPVHPGAPTVALYFACRSAFSKQSDVSIPASVRARLSSRALKEDADADEEEEDDDDDDEQVIRPPP